MMNELDRFTLVMDVIDLVPSLGSRAATLRQQMADGRLAARAYTREHGEDDPSITGWTWPARDTTARRIGGTNASMNGYADGHEDGARS
jgi:xylulose-5-phosphate/fructose-6-phosphate phosphoketolase